MPHIKYDPACTSVPIVDRVAVRMIISPSVGKGWPMEYIEVNRAVLHDKYGYSKPLFIRESFRAGGTYMHSSPVGLLLLNLYGKPPSKYYYIYRVL